MRVNTRFTVAIHILALIELNRIKFEESINTSENLALSINTNPVVIRRLLSQLKKAGFVDVKAGTGGAALKKQPKEISLLDIYKTVRNENDKVFDIHQTSNPKCYVGSKIYNSIFPILSSAENAFENQLKSYSLADVIISIAKENNMELDW